MARRPKRRLRTMDAEARAAEKLIPSAAPRQDPPFETLHLRGWCSMACVMMYDVGLVYSYSVRETDKPRERTGSTAAGQPQASNSHSGGTPSRSNGGVTAAGAMDVDVGREWRLGLWACRLVIGTPLGKKQKQMRSEPARASPGRSTINGFSVMFLCRHGLNSHRKQQPAHSACCWSCFLRLIFGCQASLTRIQSDASRRSGWLKWQNANRLPEPRQPIMGGPYQRL